MKHLIVIICCFLILVTSCKKDPDAGKIKYEAIFEGSGYEDIDISYTNEFLNTNTINNNTSANWSKTIESEPGKNYSFSIAGEPTGPFSLTTRIYYSGDVVDEVNTTSYDNGNGQYQVMSSSLSYSVPTE